MPSVNDLPTVSSGTYYIASDADPDHYLAHDGYSALKAEHKNEDEHNMDQHVLISLAH